MPAADREALEAALKELDAAGAPLTKSKDAKVQELLPDVLEGKIEPGRVFDLTTNLDGVPDGYRAMNEREALKVMIEF